MSSPHNFYKLNQDGLIVGVNFINSPNYDNRPKNISINMIVIHSISLPPNKFGGKYIEDFFTNKLNTNQDPYFKEINNLKVSAHFLIKRNGELIQFVSCKHRAWHTGDSNRKNKWNCNDY